MSELAPVPTVSVIIPAKNRAGVLARTIDSVIAQTHRPDEIILVDDGSSDATLDVARACFDQCTGIVVRIISNTESVGAPEARNIGARAAIGNFLAFLDSDDSWAPEKLERQLAVMQQEPDVVAAFSGAIYHRAGQVRTKIIPQPIITQKALMRHNVIGPTSSCLVRSGPFHAVGGFRRDLPACQDWDLWLRLSTAGNLRMLQEPLLHYHYDAGQQISRQATKVIAGHRLVFEAIYRMLEGNPRAIAGLKAEHELLLAKLNAMMFYDAPATFRHLQRALRASLAPRHLARACHYGLRVTYHRTRLALKGQEARR